MKPIDLETTAYITQLAEELRVFLTDTGEVIVMEKPIKKELKRMLKNEESIDDIKHFTHFIEFNVKDQGAEIKLKGFGHSLEEAAKKAKEAAYKYLGEITNDVISHADRVNEINAIVNKTNTVH